MPDIFGTEYIIVGINVEKYGHWLILHPVNGNFKSYDKVAWLNSVKYVLISEMIVLCQFWFI